MFTIQAQETCDLLTMTLEDLEKMNQEFPNIAKELMDDATDRLNKSVAIKVNCIREQELQ
jgi:CRP-like cAMP-binding protein